jgi:hypothetical protein
MRICECECHNVISAGLFVLVYSEIKSGIEVCFVALIL